MACCFGRKRRKATRSDEDDTLVSLPATVRKLKIDHGRVVTAPSSPMRSAWPSSLYSATSTKRSSRETTYQDKLDPMDMRRPTTTTSSVVAGPPSPTYSTFSFAPSVVRQAAAQAAAETGSTRRTSIRKPTLQTMAEVDSSLTDTTSMRSMTVSCLTEMEECRVSNMPALPSESKATNFPIRVPDAALTSPRATLAAISNAALGAGPATRQHSRTRSSSNGALPVARAKSAPTDVHSLPSQQKHRTPASPGTSPAGGKKEKSRKHRPPPITTSRSSPQIPTTFLKPGSEASSVASSPADKNKDLPASPPKTPDRSRQSIFSITSSQYSPTASIRPANHVQMVQAIQVQQVNTSGKPTGLKIPPTTGTRLADIVGSPAAVSPKPLFPPNYSISSPSKANGQASLAGMVAGIPPTPGSHRSPAIEPAGFVTAPTSATSSKTIYRPAASPEVPLTSASLTFPPNLPDYSFSPTAEGHPPLPYRSRKSSNASGLSSRSGSLPEAVQEERPTEAAELEGNAWRPTHLRKSSKAAIEISLKDVGLKGTATVTISELAGMAHLQKTRQTAYGSI